MTIIISNAADPQLTTHSSSAAYKKLFSIISNNSGTTAHAY